MKLSIHKTKAGTIRKNKIKTRQILEANEMKILRKIIGKTKNSIRSHEIRESYGIQPINEWNKKNNKKKGMGRACNKNVGPEISYNLEGQYTYQKKISRTS